jgi:hypothetical protein
MGEAGLKHAPSVCQGRQEVTPICEGCGAKPFPGYRHGPEHLFSIWVLGRTYSMWRQPRHKQSKPSEVQPRELPNNGRNCWKASDSPRTAPVQQGRISQSTCTAYVILMISVPSPRQNRGVHTDLQALAIRVVLSSASGMMIDVVIYHDLWCPSSNPQTLQ